MAFPEEQQIRQAILEELQGMGGQAQVNVLLPRVTQRLMARFPDFTNADLKKVDPSGMNSWEHRLHSVRSRMVNTQPPLLDPLAPRGVWHLPGRIPPPLLPLGEADKLAEEIKSLLQKLVELAKKGEQGLPHKHDELVERMKEMGEMLGKIAETNWGPKYKHDCVWKDNPYANPKLVVEVCDKGNLYKDIVSLPWAVQTWGAKGILVLFDDSDFQAAKGQFHPGSQVYPLKATDMLKLHSLLQAGYIEAIRSIFGL